MGSPQVINCTVSTVSGVESSSVMISWMGPGGNINDSRITISPTTYNSGYNYTSSLQFSYLMEGDESTYSCNVIIIGISESQSVEIQSLASKLYFWSSIIIIVYHMYSPHSHCKCDCPQHSDSGSVTNTAV